MAKEKRKYAPKADAPPKVPYHEQVATKLIEQLEAGTAPWQRPWTPGSLSLPHNPVSGTKYRGSNVVWLQMQGHEDPRWMTYKQAASVGAQVRKGEHGTIIQYWKMSDRVLVVDDNGKPVMRDGEKVYRNVQLERPRSFTSVVFNASQIDGLPPLVPTVPAWDRHDRAEALLKATGADIRHDQGDNAFYRPSTDRIHMPSREQFPNADAYYGTAFHEVGHWTGHPSRLARDLAHPFRSEGYAKEELRAEIASLMLGDELGIGHDPGQHAAYVQSWIKALREDPKEILRASRDADRIAAFVLAFEKEREVAPESLPAGGPPADPGTPAVPPTAAGAPEPAPIAPPQAPAASTALHTEIPAHGLPVLPEDLTGTWPTAAVERVAADAAQAVTERQRQPEQFTVPGHPEPYQIPPPLLYAYVLPATDTHHGAMRLLPADQPQPEGWDKADSAGIRPGLMDHGQLQAVLHSIAVREHVISTATVPTPSAEAPAPAQPAPVTAGPTPPAAEGEIPNDVRAPAAPAPVAAPSPAPDAESPAAIQTRLQAQTQAIFARLEQEHGWVPREGGEGLQKPFTDGPPLTIQRDGPTLVVMHGAVHVNRLGIARDVGATYADTVNTEVNDYVTAQRRFNDQTGAILSSLERDHGWTITEGGRTATKSFENMRHPTSANPATAGTLTAYRHDGAQFALKHGQASAGTVTVPPAAGADLAARVSAEADAYVTRFRDANGLPDPANQDREPPQSPVATPTADHRYATAAGEQLAIALERRDLKHALDVLRPLSVKNAQIAAIDAGLSVGRSKNKPEFFADIQSQLLQATRGPERTPLTLVTAPQTAPERSQPQGPKGPVEVPGKAPAPLERRATAAPARPKVARER